MSTINERAFLLNDLLKWVDIERELILAVCLVLSLLTIFYQSKVKLTSQKMISNSSKRNNEERTNTLDDYQHRDLFHFFIVPEFHVDKLHLARGNSTVSFY